MNLKEAALSYARAGFKVFPLQPDTKSKHVLKSWIEEASSDEQIIRRWWNYNPNYNIGIKTGNGLCVIDIDCKNGKDGVKSLETIKHIFPETKIVKTCNGGYHLYYKADRKIKNRVNILDGVDIRGDGGYVIASPSIVNNRPYVDVNHLPIANINYDMYKFLNQKENSPKENRNESGDIQQGSRNNDLFKIASTMQANGLSDETITKKILKINSRNCNPPLDQEEVHQIIQSALKYPKGKQKYISATELLHKENTSANMVVDGLVPIGATIVAAPSKFGKSFFCLELSYAVAKGNKFLGRNTKNGEVLYLAFEDPEYRFSERMKMFQYDDCDDLIVYTKEKMGKNFDLEKEIQNRKMFDPDFRMVIVDTYEKIRKNKEKDYSIEYDEFTNLQDLATKYQIAIVLVMHTIKSIDEKEPFNAIQGSEGVKAAAESMIVMFKKDDVKRMYITGKDVLDDMIYFQQDKSSNMKIKLLEDKEEEDIIDPYIMKVINYVVFKKDILITCGELCSILKLDISANSLGKRLFKNKKVFEENYIHMDALPRTAMARQYQFKYFGNDSYDNNDKNDSFSRAP